MSSLKTWLQPRRRAVAGAILLAGIVAGLAIYVAAPPEDDALEQQLQETKQYQRQMEEYGGTANLLASQFRDWFSGLWHGRTLGITVFCLSVLLALGAFVALTPLPPRRQ